MIDAYDFVAFGVFAGMLVVAQQVVVTLGSLPGKVATKRNHPHAAAVNVAGWVGIATLTLGALVGGTDAISFILMGVLWPVALVWAFVHKPVAADAPLAGPPSEGHQGPAGREVPS